MFEVGKNYFFRLKGANREIQYRGKVLDVRENLIEILDRDGVKRILNVYELIDSEVKE